MCSLGTVQTPGIQKTSPSRMANHCDRRDPILGMCKNSNLATLFESALRRVRTHPTRALPAQHRRASGGAGA